jgi:hypothetical protein
MNDAMSQARSFLNATTNQQRRRHRWLSIAAAVVLGVVTLPVPITAGADTDTDTKGVRIPRLANGKPDFSGIWQTTSTADYDLEPHGTRKDAPPGVGIVAGGSIPYTPEALAQRKKNFEVREQQDPRLKCWTLGTPRGIYYPEPFQLFQRANDLTLVFEFGDSVRTIHADGTLHPLDTGRPDTSYEYWLGDSRGHWQGDTLVVDVTDFNDQTWLDRSGNFHDEALHVVERWRLIDANTIDYKATLEDPNIYSRPWSIEVLLYRHRESNFQLIENYCYTLDYDQYYPFPKQ